MGHTTDVTRDTLTDLAAAEPLTANANAAGDSVIRFQVGQYYQCRSIGDHNCIYRFRITKRTAKCIWFTDGHEEKRTTIKTRDGIEFIKPHGTYSMSSTLFADRISIEAV